MRQKVLNIYALPSGQSAERGIDGIYFLFLWSCFFSHGVCGFGLSQEGQFFLLGPQNTLGGLVWHYSWSE
ncbi:MAG: hypothetical protein ACYTGA_03155 [Planctomycetota bacterium]|jgi:hypothetical protein